MSEDRTRIFIGGIGETITQADLERTFSSLGEVSGVEIIRSNGRNFGYMNFVPANAKSLAKLFSMYNGCVWKGGRLRLEKAKEHYLVRMKREWEEDAKALVNSFDAHIKTNNATPEKKKCLPNEDMQLHIFFPKLKKVKSLPYKGSGKHKYSFQRCEVPPLPVHFCDCVEHCKPLEKPSSNRHSSVDEENSTVNEGEINMMRCVMENLFRRETKARDETGLDLPKGRNIPEHCTDDTSLDKEEDHLSEDDNLLINITNDSKISDSGHVKQRKTAFEDLEITMAKLASSHHKPSLSDLVACKRKNKDSKSISEALNTTSTSKDNINKGTSVRTKDQSNSEKPDRSIRGQDDGLSQKLDGDCTDKGSVWVQKSSWREPGKQRSDLFQISNILGTMETGDNSTTSKNSDSQTTIVSEAVSDDRSNQHKLKAKKKRKMGCCIKEFPANETNHFSLDQSHTHESITAGCDQESLETNFQELKDLTEPPVMTTDTELMKSDINKISWSQKSSWKEMVGSDTVLFNISNVLPDMKLSQSCDAKVTDLKVSNHPVSIIGNESDPTLVTQKEDPAIQIKETEEKKQFKFKCEKSISIGGTDQARDDSNQRKEFSRPIASSFSPFVRSAESEKEWSKTRKILSGLLKKKTNNIEPSNSSKGARERER